MSKIGYIYILTNKSFKDNCIKIGYSVDVERRVKDLSGSGLPYDYIRFTLASEFDKIKDRLTKKIKC